jgi:hypothetical protein
MDFAVKGRPRTLPDHHRVGAGELVISERWKAAFTKDPGVPGTVRFRVDPNAAVLLPLSAACFFDRVARTNGWFFTVHRKPKKNSNAENKIACRQLDGYAGSRIRTSGCINDFPAQR